MSILRKNAAWITLFAVGTVLLLVGIAGGEATVVFMKAVRVCLECIGIG